MPLEETLKTIELEIAENNLGQARDRLTGLISSYPDDLGLRRRLGDVYWRLGDRAMAGRYWYLESTRTGDMKVAVKAFEHSQGHDPYNIARCLKYRGDPKALPAALRKTWSEGAGAGGGDGPGVITGYAPKIMPPMWVYSYGCMLLLAVIATLAIVGLVSVLRMLTE